MEAGHLRENPQTPQQQETSEAITYFFWPAPCAFRRVAVYWDLLVYHVTIAAP